VPRIVLAGGLAILIAAFAFGGSRAHVRLTGSNGIGDGEFVAIVGPGRTLCQSEGAVDAGTGSLRMVIGTYGRPGPELRTSVRFEGGRTLKKGTLAPGWRQGPIDLPLGEPTPAMRGGARICVANRGDARVAVAGIATPRGRAARVGGRPARGRVRFGYVQDRPTSAFSLTDRIVDRSTFGRGLWDGLAPWAALGFVLLAAAAAARALLIAGSRP
jgi:hypothetical protein